jgi:alkylation response protein AidB-like acyl-CoA dehydrogenase
VTVASSSPGEEMTRPGALPIIEIREALRRAGPEKIEPLAAQVDRTQEFSPELWRLLCELGVPSLPFSEEVGGIGGSYETYVAGIEEVAFFGAVAALYPGPTVQVASAIMRHGSELQKSRWGLELVQARAMGAWSFTEPQTGSDPRQITTRAERTREGWLLTGTKMFTSFAPYADVALVFARTGPDSLGAFIVDTKNPGWQPGSPIKMLAFGGQGTCPVTLTDLRLLPESLLGAADSGFDIMVNTEAEAKVRAGAICVGIGRRALEESVRYATERTHRGEPIGLKFPTVRALIGEMSAHVDAARVMVKTAARAIDQGSVRVKQLAASTRIVCARMARETTSNAMQVCGAYGFTQEMILERLYREGKFYEVGQGVIELQKLIVGKQRLMEYKELGRLGSE